MEAVSRAKLNEAYGLLALQGDKGARDLLILDNQSLVHHFQHKYRWNDDETAEATLGLVRAAQTYDPTSPNAAAFTTYAAYFIIGMVKRYNRYHHRHSAPGGELLVFDSLTPDEQHAWQEVYGGSCRSRDGQV